MSKQFEILLYAALADEFYGGESGIPGTTLDKPTIEFVNALEAENEQLRERLAAYEVGYDPKVHPAPDTWVLMKNCDDEFIPVQWDSEAKWYWNWGDGEEFDFWYDDNIDLRKWFPWLGSKEDE